MAKSKWRRKFKLVGGPHDGEYVKPTATGKGLPVLISRTCELAGGMGTCRSAYEFDVRRKVYQFKGQQVF
jgi:hypothetical protein